jgi:serine/threonine-protein kinase
MKNDCFVVIYEYAEGECLFDHWNFDKYKEENIIDTPSYRFKKLSLEKRLNVIEKLFVFFEHVIESNYVAVDFYDSSIIYDFNNDNVTFCDIDLFRKMPTKNDLGKDYFGTKRLKAPEENELGAVIDEQTSLFTLGAIIFDMFSNASNIKERYTKGCFIPNKIDEFELNNSVYNVLLKATAYNRKDRYKTLKEFREDFYKNIYS